MRYLNFKVKNYKGIQGLELDLTRLPSLSVYTLVGLNESGKTTILEAINHLANKVDDPHSLVPKSKRANFTDKIGLSTDIELSDDDKTSIQIFLKEKGFELENISDVITYRHVYNFKDTVLQTGTGIYEHVWSISIKGHAPVDESEGVPETIEDVELKDFSSSTWSELLVWLRQEIFPKIVYYPDFLFNFPARIYLVESPTEDDEQAYYRQLLQDILDSLNQGLTIEKHLVERKVSGTANDIENIEKVLNDMSGTVTKTVFDAWGKVSGKKPKDASVTLGSDLKVDETDPSLYYVEMKVKQGTDSYFINERSLGFRWFFAFLLFTQFRKFRKDESKNTIFLLDEPASNLHQRGQQELLDSLETVTEGATVIYSTHSHHLIKPEWLTGAFIITNKGLDYDTEVMNDDFNSSKTDIIATPYHRYVAENPNEETHYKPILDVLDYTPSKLEYIPSIVIPEGKYDYFVFKYFEDVILKNKIKLNLYPGAGANKHFNIISLYLAWGRDFLVMLDDDRAGKKAKEAYLKEFGRELEKRIFTLVDVDAGFDDFQTESLLPESERLAIIQAVFPTVTAYNKSLFNRAVQELLVQGKVVKVSAATKSNFKKIFAFLKTKLGSMN